MPIDHSTSMRRRLSRGHRARAVRGILLPGPQVPVAAPPARGRRQRPCGPADANSRQQGVQDPGRLIQVACANQSLGRAALQFDRHVWRRIFQCIEIRRRSFPSTSCSPVHRPAASATVSAVPGHPRRAADGSSARRAERPTRARQRPPRSSRSGWSRRGCPHHGNG